MLLGIISAIGTIVSSISLYLYVRYKYGGRWKRLRIARGNTIVLAMEDRNLREAIAELLSKNGLRVVEASRTDEARRHLHKKTAGVLITDPKHGDYIDGVDLCSGLKERGFYTVFITPDSQVERVHGGIAKEVQHPFFEVLSQWEAGFSKSIVEIAKKYYKSKTFLKEVNRWKRMGEISGVTIMYVSIGDLRARFHEHSSVSGLRKRRAWFMYRCLRQITTILEKYGGKVYINMGEGMVAAFLPGGPGEDDKALNNAIQSAKEILTDISTSISKYHLNGFINIKVGIASERVIHTIIEIDGKPMDYFSGIAVDYARCLALWDQTEDNSILIFKPPLDRAECQHLRGLHNIREASTGETGTRSQISGVEFYRI